MRLKFLLAVFLLGCSANPANVQDPQDAEVVEPPPKLVHVDTQPLLVTSFGVWSDDVLLHTERAQLAEALIQRINAGDLGPYTAESYQSAKARWESVLKGTYPNGKQCSDVPSPNAVDKALRPDALVLEARIDCKDDCELRVSVKDRSPKQTLVEDFMIALPRDRTTWLDSVIKGEFEPYPEEEGAGGLGVMNHDPSKLREPTVRLRFTDLTDDWNKSAKELTPVFQSQVESLRTCRSSESKIWRDWWSNRYVLDVDAAGIVTKCEQSIDDHLPRPWFGCECQVITSSVGFGPGSEDRRMRTVIDILEPNDLGDDPSSASSKNGFRKSVWLSSDAMVGTDPLSEAIGVNALSYTAFEACYQYLPADTFDVEVPVEFVIDREGRTKSVSAQWPSSIPTPFAECAIPILNKADFACPMNDEATQRGILKVSVRK